MLYTHKHKFQSFVGQSKNSGSSVISEKGRMCRALLEYQSIVTGFEAIDNRYFCAIVTAGFFFVTSQSEVYYDVLSQNGTSR